ncbi:MAG: DUF1295 domain-containing protein [Anaerolineae bacterium]|nr:DUF1295 domain-containing protein [Anaerolineae bacterium]
MEQLLSPISPLILALIGLTLVIASIGFRKTLWFISVGYAFAITGMVIVTVLVYRDQLTLIAGLQNVALLLWSLRLGVYLVRREATAQMPTSVNDQVARAQALPIMVKFFIWVSVSLLYVAMYSPALFMLTAPAQPTGISAVIAWLGVIVLYGGLILETVADQQKSAFKLQSPGKFCDVGLYRLVRCPNYLGEIMVWLGSWVIGLSIYNGILQWVISLIGLACITLIMMGSTKRLEKGQSERYGHLPEYQQYVTSVPVLFPFIPVYTLENVRVYIE